MVSHLKTEKPSHQSSESVQAEKEETLRRPSEGPTGQTTRSTKATGEVPREGKTYRGNHAVWLMAEQISGD